MRILQIALAVSVAIGGPESESKTYEPREYSQNSALAKNETVSTLTTETGFWDSILMFWLQRTFPED